MTFVTTRHRETTAGALRLILETEHAPTPGELDDLEQFERIWTTHHREPGEHVVRAPDAVVAEMDEAIWALGGEEEITAG
jgi:hypothetical protein